MCLVTHFLLLGATPVGTGTATHDGSAILLEYTISLSATTTYKCKATLVAAPNTETEATVNIFKTG